MTDTKNQRRRQQGTDHIAYQVRDRDGKKGFWTRIGSAWPHAMARGSTSRLKLCPSTDASRFASLLRKRNNSIGRAD